MGEVGDIAKSRIANDLRTIIDKSDGKGIRVIIEFDAGFSGGETAARAMLLRHVLNLPQIELDNVRRPTWYAIAPFLDGAEFVSAPPRIDPDTLELFNSVLTEKYLFAELEPDVIMALADLKAKVPKIEGGKKDDDFAEFNLVYKIWLDAKIAPLVYVSSRTVKCDAARVAFKSAGRGIVWAVADTGVARHPHFLEYANLDLPDGLRHWDFTQKSQDPKVSADGALTDTVGHGTHVAGIIAGSTVPEKDRRKKQSTRSRSIVCRARTSNCLRPS